MTDSYYELVDAGDPRGERFAPSDHVISKDWDRMAAIVLPDHVGPYLLRDVGHFVPWEAPGRFTQAVVSFCSDLLATR